MGEALEDVEAAEKAEGESEGRFGGFESALEVFAEYLKEKTSGLAVVAKAKGSEYYAFAKVKSLEIGQLASKKAMEFDFDERRRRK